MEDKPNMIKKGTKGRAGGCPTRLQKRAPASLEIDKVLNGRPANPFAEASSSRAIPLLSPLILSPQPWSAETAAQPRASDNNGNGSSSNECRSSSTSSTPTTGWEHPAMAPFPEPSSLCNVFRKQCVFVNHAQ